MLYEAHREAVLQHQFAPHCSDVSLHSPHCKDNDVLYMFAYQKAPRKGRNNILFISYYSLKECVHEGSDRICGGRTTWQPALDLRLTVRFKRSPPLRLLISATAPSCATRDIRGSLAFCWRPAKDKNKLVNLVGDKSEGVPKGVEILALIVPDAITTEG